MHLRDLTQYLSELSENNNRAWFVMNKPRYDILRAEFLELAVELIAGISKFDPVVAACNPKRALFRINRDLRFARNRDPYKTTFSASITASGLKKPSQGGGPAYYFHIDANGQLLIACGEYLPPADRLRMIRNHIVNDAAGFGKLLKNKGLNDSFGGLSHESQLVRPPKGFAADERHIEQIRLKSFLVWKESAIRKVSPDKLPSLLLQDFRDGAPLVKWLRGAGPTP
jgi:uncharacterized protein (TIGR02453 family)